jgi:negative regulator of sigma E activity
MSRANGNSGMKTAGTNQEMSMDATDLTQLSSREQLSALMDGALPADETRFLLRRLQHDDSLAECWQRWRLSAEVMRGLAPTQRLPSDFASRVAASLRGDEIHAANTTNSELAGETSVRSPAWLRWSGGAAMAASIAVVAFMTYQPAPGLPNNLRHETTVALVDAAPSIARNSMAVAKSPAPSKRTPHAPTQDPANPGFESQTAALASAVAIMAKPMRKTIRGDQARAMQSNAMLPAVNAAQPASTGTAVAVNDLQPFMLQSGHIVRPWPRSVLPQYAGAGMTVGFGDSTRNSEPYNPFQVRTQIGNLPAKLRGQLDGQAGKQPVQDRNEHALDGVAENESPPQP